MLSRKRTQPRSHRRLRNQSLQIESLETRALLAVTATLTGGVLEVTGDGANNEITLRLDANGTDLLVFDAINPIGTFNLGTVGNIEIEGQDGDDVMIVDDPDGSLGGWNTPITMDGGGGTDLVVGSRGNLSLSNLQQLAATLQAQQTQFVTTATTMAGSDLPAAESAAHAVNAGAETTVFTSAYNGIVSANNQVFVPADALANTGDTLVNTAQGFVADVQNEIVNDAEAIITGDAHNLAYFNPDLDHANGAVIPTAESMIDFSKQQTSYYFPEEFSPCIAANVNPHANSAIQIADQIDQQNPTGEPAANDPIWGQLEGAIDNAEQGLDTCAAIFEVFEGIVETAGQDWENVILGSDAGLESSVELGVLADEPVLAAAAETNVLAAGESLQTTADSLALDANAAQANFEATTKAAAAAIESQANDLQVTAANLESQLAGLVSGLWTAIGADMGFVTGGSSLPASGGRSGGGCASTTNTILGGAGFDVLIGTGANDRISDTSGGGIFLGLGGDDTLSGSSSTDFMLGGDGDDCLSGNDGLDILLGMHGEDELTGGAGIDLAFGGSGIDRSRGTMALICWWEGMEVTTSRGATVWD